ncbi:sprT domain-containing protein [Fibrella sp. HMF5405]|uniref:SprT domain-containing protein n=1 Tax=Fibrella forsythiae TaxID=2817061 RepID=A0ABS3JIT9_9BACT|nr:sprT domain-containing protein [Fibrella forsythiae]
MPTLAVTYCQQLQQQYPFGFRIVKPRRTRLGDFRALPNGTAHITVNADLNPYAFLITYVHEVAHCAVYHTYKRAGKPHGPIWQSQFQRLMAPLLTESIFPADVLAPLRYYMSRPAATTAAQPALMQALRRYNVQSPAAPVQGQLVLRQLAEGQLFLLQKKTYMKGKLRRTRIVCKDIQSGRSYAVLADVLVMPVNENQMKNV